MKSNLAAILLVLACAGLGIGLWMQNQNHIVQTKDLAKAINSYSNRVTTLEEMLQQDGLVRTNLESSLIADRLRASNDLAVAQTTLAGIAASRDKALADAKLKADAVAAAAAAIEERDKKIHELEGQNKDLDKASEDLHSRITDLGTQIVAIQKKLDSSEGDRRTLQNELKELQKQKEELERRLSDLAALKEQVRTLQENLSIAKRLELMRVGIYDFINKKGGERMVTPLPPGPPAPIPNKPLDVELHQNGPVRIISPALTNAPATNVPAVRAPAANVPATNPLVVRAPGTNAPAIRAPSTNVPPVR